MFGFGKQASFVDNPNIQVQVFDQALKEGLTVSPNLVGAIDQGTSSTRFLLFTVQGQVAASAQMEHKQIFPDGQDKVSIDRCRCREPRKIFLASLPLLVDVANVFVPPPLLGRLART
jgi:hypothetical protein